MPTESGLPEAELHARVKERLDTGQLPTDLFLTISAGFGTQASCAVCDERISVDKVEFDVTDPRSGTLLSFHFACFSIWQRQCAARMRAARAASPQEG
jgi:hypothetical protein